MSIEFADGHVGATADTDRPPATDETKATQDKAAPREQKPAAPKRVAKPVDQGSLF
jgi:exodeoxyribonuclease VII large subunit